MSWQLILIITVVVLIFFLGSGLWIAFALAVAGLVGLLAFSGTSLLGGLAFVTWNTMNNFTMVAVPLFLFMGELILRSGMSEKFYQGLTSWLYRLPGGLLHSNIAACSLMAAISGSSVATAVSIGSAAIPAMQERGYAKKSIYGSLAAGGTLGILIPPSTIMIIYGGWTEQSVGRLFMAGVIPGFMLAAIFMIFILIHATLQPSIAPREQVSFTWRQMASGVSGILPVVVTMVIVLGGMYTGLATATEAAALGVLCVLIISVIYRTLTIRSLNESLAATVRTTAWIFFIVTMAQVLQFGLVTSGVTRQVVEAVIALNLSPMVFMLAIILMYSVMGCLIEGISMMLLTLPIVYPIMVKLGFDPIWFGVLLTMLIELALITPPVGLNLFVIQGISGSPLNEVVAGCVPYWFLMLFGVILLLFFPQIALWLPAHMMG